MNVLQTVIKRFNVLLSFLCLLIIYSCGLYDNKYSEGILKTNNASENVFFFPGLANLNWAQSPSTPAINQIIHTMSVINLSGAKLDSLHAITLAYSGTARNFKNLVFIAPIKFKHYIDLFPQNTDTLIFQRISKSIKGQEVHLLRAYPYPSNPFQGYYSGSYTLYKNNEVIDQKRAIGFVDYLGASGVLLELQSLASRIEGNTDANGNFLYSIQKENNDVLETGLVTFKTDQTSLLIKIPVNRLPNADTLKIDIALIP